MFGVRATQRFFCCCFATQRFVPRKEAAVTSSQLTASLCEEDKGDQGQLGVQGKRATGRGRDTREGVKEIERVSVHSVPVP